LKVFKDFVLTVHDTSPQHGLETVIMADGLARM